MLKTIVVMMIAITAATAGDILLAKGMKEVGDLSAMNIRGILDAALRALTSVKLIIGTVLLAVFFFLWLAVLSWEDVSIAVPMQAMSYVFVALFAHFILGEPVTPMRWAGVALVSAGVVLITKSGVP